MSSQKRKNNQTKQISNGILFFIDEWMRMNESMKRMEWMIAGVGWAFLWLRVMGAAAPGQLGQIRDQPTPNQFIINPIHYCSHIPFICLSSNQLSTFLIGLGPERKVSWLVSVEWRSPINQTKEINQCCSLGGIGWFLWWVMGRSPSAPQDNPFH